MAATLTELRREVSGSRDPEYTEKYMHAIPNAPVVDRVQYIVERCRGKKVLSLGASGPAQKLVQEAAAQCWGVDCVKVSADTIICDLDKTPEMLGQFKEAEVILAAEVLEHLSNPGRVLDECRKLGCPIVVTVPNAFSDLGRRWVLKDEENVNSQHVAYYSYRTLRVLLERHGFDVVEFLWYGGNPLTAEGIIMFGR